MSKEKLAVILGPTAVGKTAFSIALAKAIGTEIISGDSMLVYRGMDIGTAKPSLAEREGIPHHLVDILAPEEEFNVARFQAMAAEKIAQLNARGKIPLLVGGTGLYIKSLLEGYRFSATKGDGEYRKKLETLAAERGKAYVHQLLAEADPQTAARLHVNDVRRVIRALEVIHCGNERISQEKRTDGLAYDAYVLGLHRDRQALYRRIEQRVEDMFSQGLEEEVRKLLRRGIPREAQSMQGIGYKETAACLAGEISREEAMEQIKKATRHFAKRQLSWYRNMPYIHWHAMDHQSKSARLPVVLQEISRQMQNIPR